MTIKFVPPTPEELAARGLNPDGTPIVQAPKAKTTKKAEKPVVEETSNDDAV